VKKWPVPDLTTMLTIFDQQQNEINIIWCATLRGFRLSQKPFPSSTDEGGGEQSSIPDESN